MIPMPVVANAGPFMALAKQLRFYFAEIERRGNDIWISPALCRALYLKDVL